MNAARGHRYMRSVVLSLLVSILVLGVLGSTALAATYRSRTLKLGHIAAQNHPVHEWALKFKERLEAITGGAMKVEIYPNAQLGSGRDMASGLQFGALEIGLLDVSFYSFVPQAQIFEYPFLFRDYAHFRKALDGPIGEEVRRLARNAGYELLGWAEFGRRHMTNNVRPIYTPEDLKGLRMRVPPGAIYVQMMEAVGAHAAAVDFTELYLSLQLRAVDGQENPLSSIQASKLFEVQKYLSLTGHMYTLLYPAMNARTFAGFNADEQAAIRQAGQEATLYTRQLVEDSEEDLLNGLVQAGMQVNEVDARAFAAVTDAVARTLRDRVPLEWIEQVRAIQ